MDEVVGVVGIVNDRGLLIAKSVVRPDIPTSRPFRGARGHVRAAFMSDIHVGSRTFLEDKWSKVSEWLAGGGQVAPAVRDPRLIRGGIGGVGRVTPPTPETSRARDPEP